MKLDESDQQEELEQVMTELKSALEQQSKADVRWHGVFTEREQRLIANCQLYAANNPSGLPGHNLMIIIDKLSKMLKL